MANTPFDLINTTGEACIICATKFRNGDKVVLFDCGHFMCNDCHENLIAVRATYEDDYLGEEDDDGRIGNGCPVCRSDDEVAQIYQAVVYHRGTQDDPVVVDED
ncbi:unknown protein [Seminavis robusta]|uniref:RING-type domain-containing protein n=1 Tax=Seminavis robusta TaxID=568900 RepID=A0A9N8HTA8_9STRA|nr:unknown protein [Seminavis robusta]|eukprot:Sro1849_g301500.1 n/a (104) ;mRNA; f:11479-11790